MSDAPVRALPDDADPSTDAGLSTDAPPPAGPPRSHARRWILALVAAVTLLVTAAGVTVSVSAVVALQNLPRTLVAQYLGELQHGRAEAAMKLAGIRANSGDVLLNDAAYGKITDRISSFTVQSPVTRGDTTTVQARITQGERTYDRSFVVEQAGGLPWLPFWRLGRIEPDTVDLMVQGPAGIQYTVAGVKPQNMPLATDVILRALPGTYPVELVSTSANFDVPVSAVATTPAGAAASPTVFTARLTDAGQAAARTAIDTWLDGCVASHDAVPAHCPFGTFPDNASDVVSNVRWQLHTRPDVTIDPVWTTGGWVVESTTGSISAQATLTRTSDGGTGEGYTDPWSFDFRGILTFDGRGPLFTPLIAGDGPAAQAGA
ncbi:hypothetical protein [Leifsonia sp. EB34]|uniref:hypothetical protein n=1 Tax=Leifsonia sp. EB34 TaxID=3156303 RepID=UPI0035158B27